MTDRPHFPAATYARARPGYPDELFAFLATLPARRALAWDCATGNGQAALGLAGHFDAVVATDVSDEQIAHATPHPRIQYRVAPAEASGIGEKSVDLITVASAIHWFERDRFYTEARRVGVRHVVLAAWTYHIEDVEPPFGAVFARLYRELQPYFAAGARLVDDRYESILLPGKAIECPPFVMSAEWDLERTEAFVMSWSGTVRYLRETGKNPIDLVRGELEALWGGDPRSTRRLRWPLYMKASRR